MSDVISKIGDGFANTFLMAYEVWWALVLGFAISGAVQAWVPRQRIEESLGGGGLRPVALAAGLGASAPGRKPPAPRLSSIRCRGTHAWTAPEIANPST